MNQKITIAAVIGFGALAVAIYSYITPSQTGTAEVVEAESSSILMDKPASADVSTEAKAVVQQPGADSSSPSAEDYQYVQDRLDVMRERRPDVHYNADEVAAAMARTDAWTPLSSPPAGLPLSPEELTDGREFIDFDSLKLETLVPGDSVKLAIGATDQEYDVKIDDVEIQDESRLKFSGHIEGYDGQSYYVSFNKGETLTMGGIDTPDGHFTIQAHGDKGWVASSGALFKEHVDPIVPPGMDGQSTESGHTHEGHDHAH